MIIPKTNIQLLRHVACTIGEVTNGKLDTRLSKLCTSDKVNQYSRYRPGYWYVDTSGNLAFQRPRGGNQIDPRGDRSDGTGNKESYHLGDFAGYNPDALAPSFNTGVDTIEYIYASASGGSEITADIVFNMGEVDWFNEETLYHGKNYINAGAYDHLYAYRTQNSSKVLVGSGSVSDLERSGNTARMPIALALTLPSTGSTTYEITVGLGTANKAVAWFPNKLNVKITRLQGAYLMVRVLSSALSSLKTRLTGLSDADMSVSLYDVELSGHEKELTSALSFVTFNQLRFVAVTANQTRYLITAARMAIAGTIKCYNKPIGQSGATLKSSNNFSQQIASNGYGLFTASFTLPETANDGEYFYIDITSFAGGTIDCEQTN